MNNVIRKVFVNGTIITFAGTGYIGYSDDGGPASNATLNQPVGITFSATGELYIVDGNNNVIRKVFDNGTIITVAGNGKGYSGDGGSAINAEFQSPYFIAISATGNIYISDTFNYRIRVIYTNGTIDTIAGTGTSGYSGDGGNAIDANLYVPTGIAVSTSGDLFISDTYNNVVRKVYTNGTIVTAVGNRKKGYSGEGVIATENMLSTPIGIVMSSSGELYIADDAENRVLIVVPTVSNECLSNGFYQLQRYCICNSGYTGSICSISICYGVNATSPFACSGHGACVSPEECSCDAGYTGENCQLISCFGRNQSSPNACSSRGVCSSPNQCLCYPGYTGYDCQLISCFEINQTAPRVCSGYGTCVSPNYCSCRSGYTGYNCELSICYGINETEPSVCSGHGICALSNYCICNQGYGGKQCQFNKKKLAYLTLLILPIVIIAALLNMMWIKKIVLWLKKEIIWLYNIKKEVRKGSELEERLLRYEMEKIDKADSINETNLRINLTELTFDTKISEGAGGVVYRGTWFQKAVAIKKLKVAVQDSFLKEVTVLHCHRHPNIIDLYGFSFDTKGFQYIITEYMEKGSLDALIYNSKLRNFKDKIQVLLDICHGMSFLHGKSIMHRDLKPQNVLVNKDNICKLCDFGVAKVMNETLTLGVVGTWQCMAPEIMIESSPYNESCDVFSFGIIMHELFTLSRPYFELGSEYVNQFTVSLQIINGKRPFIPAEIFMQETDQSIHAVANFFFQSNDLTNSSISNKQIFGIETSILKYVCLVGQVLQVKDLHLIS